MTVDPSSALRSCTVVYLTSSRPHLGQVSRTVLSVCKLCFSTACTLDCSFCLKKDGKSDGFVCVTIVLDPVSAQRKVRKAAQECFGWSKQTPILLATAFAAQNISLSTLGRRQQVSAIGAENEGPNCCHFCVASIVWLDRDCDKSRTEIGEAIIGRSGNCDRKFKVDPWNGKTDKARRRIVVRGTITDWLRG